MLVRRSPGRCRFCPVHVRARTRPQRLAVDAQHSEGEKVVAHTFRRCSRALGSRPSRATRSRPASRARGRAWCPKWRGPGPALAEHPCQVGAEFLTRRRRVRHRQMPHQHRQNPLWSCRWLCGFLGRSPECSRGSVHAAALDALCLAHTMIECSLLAFLPAVVEGRGRRSVPAFLRCQWIRKSPSKSRNRQPCRNRAGGTERLHLPPATAAAGRNHESDLRAPTRDDQLVRIAASDE